MNQVKIGKFIAQCRNEKNITQEELGEKLGVTNKTISRWENGHYLPDIEMMQLYCSKYNCLASSYRCIKITKCRRLFNRNYIWNISSFFLCSKI